MRDPVHMWNEEFQREQIRLKDERDQAEARASWRLKTFSYDDIQSTLMDMAATIRVIEEIGKLAKSGDKASIGEVFSRCFKDFVNDDEQLYDLVSRK